MKEKEIRNLGKFVVSGIGALDVTDPCYDKDVWCRTTIFNCELGEWEAEAIINDEGDLWGDRVGSLQVKLAGTTVDELMIHEEVVGYIGVDAGLAGVFVDKPDYNDEDWFNLCDTLPNGIIATICSKDSVWKCDGVVTSSGYGDGGYDVVVSKNDAGKVIGIKIIFISEDEEE
jgi:hypothetical protein